MSMNMENLYKIKKALEIAREYAGYGGEHHKDYCIDQMVRALLSCEIEKKYNDAGTIYASRYITPVKSEEYDNWVKNYQGEDENGEAIYYWETGTPP